MKSKNQIINRIGAVLCALVVLVGCFGSSAKVYASDMSNTDILQYFALYEDLFKGSEFDYEIPTLPSEASGYEYCFVQYVSSFDQYYLYCSNEPFELNVMGNILRVYLNSGAVYYWHGGADWTYAGKSNEFSFQIGNYVISSKTGDIVDCACQNPIVYTSHDLACEDVIIIHAGNGGASFDESIGYLQNVKVNHVIEEVPLGENVNEKFCSRWYFDTISTTGIDLTSGNYSINYYEERWIVKGYKEEDIIEKSDRYLLGTYGAVEINQGYFSTNSEHIKSFLQGQGYEEPGFLKLGFNKFVTTHYYLQIVDNASGKFGGYVHIYLTDDTGKFGVELIADTIDENGNIDENGYSEFVDEDKITTDDTDAGFTELEENNNVTLEELFEELKDDNAENLDELDGSQTFNTVGQGYANDVIDVTHGMRAIFMRLPDWLLGVYGLSFGFIITLVLIKSLRG